MSCPSPISAADQVVYNGLVAQRDALQSQLDLVTLQLSELGSQQTLLTNAVASINTQLSYIESGSVPVPQLAAVANFTLSVASATSVLIAWDDDSDADTFVIERALDAAFTQECTVIFDAAYPVGGDITDTPLTSLTTYYYRIQSRADGYEPSDWVQDDITPNAGTLTTPVFDTPVITANGILVIWNAVSNAVEYLLERSDDNVTWSPIYSGSELEYNDDALNNSTTYYYRLTAMNIPGGYISSTATDDWTTSGGQVPIVVGLASEYGGTDTLYITWDEVPEAVTYRLQRADDAGFTTNLATLYTGDYSASQPLNDGGVTDGNTYYYRVRGERSGWVDGDWTVISAVVLPTLAVPGNREATYDTGDLSTETFNVAFDDVSGADNFIIEYDDNAEFTSASEGYSGSYGSYSGQVTVPYYEGGVWFRVKAQGAGYLDSEWGGIPIV